MQILVGCPYERGVQRERPRLVARALVLGPVADGVGLELVHHRGGADARRLLGGEADRCQGVDRAAGPLVGAADGARGVGHALPDTPLLVAVHVGGDAARLQLHAVDVDGLGGVDAHDGELIACRRGGDGAHADALPCVGWDRDAVGCAAEADLGGAERAYELHVGGCSIGAAAAQCCGGLGAHVAKTAHLERPRPERLAVAYGAKGGAHRRRARPARGARLEGGVGDNVHAALRDDDPPVGAGAGGH